MIIQQLSLYVGWHESFQLRCNITPSSKEYTSCKYDNGVTKHSIILHNNKACHFTYKGE